MTTIGRTSEGEPMAYLGDLYYDPYPYRIGDFPTYCYVCGQSYWGSYHECRGWRPPPPPAPVTTNITVDYTWALAAAINRLAAAIEQLVARYDGDERKEEDEQ